MAKEGKKQVREAFRTAVFERDKCTCVGCGKKYSFEEVKKDCLDAHHICPREQMANGGYVKENGVSLCKYRTKLEELSCHEKAEAHLSGSDLVSALELYPDFSPEELYRKIGSSRELAEKASARL